MANPVGGVVLMPRGGHNRRPTLQVIREGGKPKEGIVLPPTALTPPDWAERLPGKSADMARARAEANTLWERCAPVLFRSVGLVNEQRESLVDYCVAWARIDQGERALSDEGVVIEGARGGSVRNPWTTVLNQYRSHFRSLAAELGLTPSAASRLTRPPIEDDDDPFD